jgi:hypothetical protein
LCLRSGAAATAASNARESLELSVIERTSHLCVNLGTRAVLLIKEIFLSHRYGGMTSRQ